MLGSLLNCGVWVNNGVWAIKVGVCVNRLLGVSKPKGFGLGVWINLLGVVGLSWVKWVERL